MKPGTFKRSGGAMIGYGVAILHATMGEIVIVAPTQAAAISAAKQVGLDYVDLKQVQRVAMSAAGAQVAAQQNGENANG